MSRDKKLKTGGKAIHPNSRKAKQLSRQECHVGRVIKKRQNTKAKYNNLRTKMQWFKDHFDETKTHLTKQEFLELIERYLQRFQDELDQIDLKNQIGQRQKTPQYAARKALIDSTIDAERNEHETVGIEVPNLTQINGVKELRNWDGSVRFMSRLKLCLVKQSTFTSTDANENEFISRTVSIDDDDEDDDESESMDKETK